MSDFAYLHLTAMQHHVAHSVRTGQPTGYRLFGPQPGSSHVVRPRPPRRHLTRHLIHRLGRSRPRLRLHGASWSP